MCKVWVCDVGPWIKPMGLGSIMRITPPLLNITLGNIPERTFLEVILGWFSRGGVGMEFSGGRFQVGGTFPEIVPTKQSKT